MDEPYSFSLRSTWIFTCPRERVWDQLADPLSWPAWWRHVQKVGLEWPEQTPGVGSVYYIVWTSRLPYKVRLKVSTTSIVEGSRITCNVSGDLRGTGIWELCESPSGCTVTYDWKVQLDAPWMRRFARVLRPIFAWNHHRVMQDGAQGLARRLGTTAVSRSD